MKKKVKDMTNQKYGKLTVIRFDHIDKHKSANWLCKCECGKEKVASRPHLIAGDIKSCGCLKKEIDHKQSSSKLYAIWAGMLDRCRNPNNKSYMYYGGKGIKVCEGWFDFKEFYKWAIDNSYKESLSIERIDNNEGYSPRNCKWIPFAEQSKNKTYKLPSSGVRNVSWHNASKKWYVRIPKNGQIVHRKLFTDFNEACDFANKKIKELELV